MAHRLATLASVAVCVLALWLTGSRHRDALLSGAVFGQDGEVVRAGGGGSTDMLSGAVFTQAIVAAKHEILELQVPM
jgi:hypothetical protein